MGRVLIACEFSGIVREAFAALGHDAWSCDLLPTEQPGQHIQGDVRDLLGDGWDLMVAHPPCTYLTVSANKWMKPEWQGKYPTRTQDRREAVRFFMTLVNAPIARIAVENPIGVMSTHYRPPTQIIQPWQFGHPEQKSTCLWLKNLPLLRPTDMVPLPDDPKEAQRMFYLPRSSDRWKLRSETYQGIADAMAAQWGTPEGLCADMPLFAQEAIHG